MLIPWFRQNTTLRKKQRHRVTRSLFIEQLEDRTVPSTFAVMNLLDGGTGSLRQAIMDANGHAGADVIDFKVAGTVRLASALPTLTDPVDLDGTSAPGFASTPVLEVDYNHFAGLQYNLGSTSSVLRSLALVNAIGAGVTVNAAGSLRVVGNFIGLGLDGTTAAGNGGNGLELIASSGNTIGGATALERNVISGNGSNGVSISGSSNNQLVGNYIGTDATGTLDRGNGGNGILVTAGSSGTVVGGSHGNVIAGNDANGVLINGHATTNSVSGNFIGLAASGSTTLGNSLDGVKVENADNNLIGQGDPVTGVTYYSADSVTLQPVTAWQGIRNADTAGQYLLVGSSNDNGLLFEGTMAGVGTSYAVNYPNAASTSVYGPDNLNDSSIRLVGSYKNADASTAAVKVNSFVFEGTTAELSNSSNYQTIDIPGAEFTYVHSTMGGLAVGNYDSALDHGIHSLPLGPGHAFLYDIATQAVLTDISFPNSISNTAYGIWYNGGTSYTICGGWSPDPVNNLDNQNQPIGQGYLVDYDSSTGEFSHWTAFTDPNGTNYVTHFEGISSAEKGVYTLNADTAQSGSVNPAQGSWVSVRRNTDGSFGSAAWVNLNYPGVDPTVNVTSSNSVYGNQVVGLVVGKNSISYQATINVGFQLSNVISGNGGNGIGLYGANDNQIAMNYLGTDVTGALALGNGGNGILVTAGAARNQIGGQATGGNDPTAPVFVRPPHGNLISGNQGNGVLIDDAATQNILSGNFIGTTASGTAALGNQRDGVAIDQADGNELIGCTFRQDPFVFYNVLGGNGGNGLRVTDSNDTTVQANFFGMGADNTTAVGNGLDGVLIEGSSGNTQFGGVIPLGNVVVANGRNGLEIAGTAHGTVVFNTFCGLPAFKLTAVPNVLDGMLITSTGGDNLIRTNVISGNGGNGVHISGNATGVQLTEDIIGMDTSGSAAIANGGNGVLIDGNAHDNLIGGEQVSVIFQNTISANGANGVAIVGNALNNQVFHSFIGTNIEGLKAFGNGAAGIFIGSNSQGTLIGGTGTLDKNVISGNQGGGIQLSGLSQGTQVSGNLIGTDRNGQLPLGNHGAGVRILSSANQVGGSAAGEANVIAFNLYGVLVDSGAGNGILHNSIFNNTLAGILLVAEGNQNQPAPVLTAAYLPTSTTVQVSGMLTAPANTTYTVEIFASPSGMPAGQGQNLLGSLTVLTNANGVAAFVLNADYSASAGGFFTVTATSPTNNTSALSTPIALGANANTIFVASAYSLLLGRAPDAQASGWVDALNNGATPASIVLGIENSVEYLTDLVAALYRHYLQREPEALGAQSWVAYLQAGHTLEQAAAGIVSSAEYFHIHGGTDHDYLLGLYQDVLGRAPSAGEVNNWAALLAAGATRLRVATGFFTSTEYRTNLVTADYAFFLGRPPEATGLTGWLNQIAAGLTEQELLAGIFGSPEGFAIWS